MDNKYCEIINQFNWEFIGESILKISDNINKSILEIIESEKDKIEKRLTLIKKLDIQKLLCENWIFVNNLNPKEPVIRIYFIPQSYMLDLNLSSPKMIIPAYDKHEEWNYLHSLLKELSTKQEYEKCQLIKERLEQIINEMN